MFVHRQYVCSKNIRLWDLDITRTETMGRMTYSRSQAAATRLRLDVASGIDSTNCLVLIISYKCWGLFK